MDWQQVVSLAVVAVAAGLLLYGQLRRRNGRRGPTACCGHAGPGQVPPSTVYRARKGERPRLVIRAR